MLLKSSFLPACCMAVSGAMCEAAGLQVDWEEATGAVSMMLIHQRITNAYRGVRNVVLAVTPRALPPGAKALLLNAHFDNTLGSPGAPK